MKRLPAPPRFLTNSAAAPNGIDIFLVITGIKMQGKTDKTSSA